MSAPYRSGGPTILKAVLGAFHAEVTLSGRPEVHLILTDSRSGDLLSDEVRLASAEDRERIAERFPPPDDEDVRGVLGELAFKLAKADRPVATAKVITLADVEVERVRWLWPGRLAYGKLAVLEGMPGTGKSQMTMMIAAAVSRGFALPGGTPMAPADVVLLTAEDGLGDTVRGRLEAAGGDPARVHVIEGIVDEHGACRFPGLPNDLLPIAHEVERRQAKLVILDPLSAYLGAVNTWKDSEVRSALAPLAGIAQATGAALVIVRHLTKAPVGQAITAGGGSIGIIGAARTAMLLAKNPDDDSRRVLAVVKNNLAAIPPSLAFRLEEQPSGWSAVTWEGASALSADDLIAAGRDVEDRNQRDEVKDFLLDMLRDGPVASDEVLRESKKLGHSKRTFDRGRAELKVESFQQGRRWFLRLPDGQIATGRQDDAQSLYSEIGGNLSEKSHLNADGTTPSQIATPGNLTWQPDAASAPSSPERPACSLCGGPLVKRRSGVTRCPECAGHSARDPYIEPRPEGGAAA